jgi:hypothetical protein
MTPADLERLVDRALADLPTPAAPPTLLPRVMHAIAAEPQVSVRGRARSWFDWSRPAQAASAALVVVLAGAAVAYWSVVQAAVSPLLAGALGWSLGPGADAIRSVGAWLRAGVAIARLLGPVALVAVVLVTVMCAACAAFGAAPVSIPLNEAYSALQTKIADGQENPLALIVSAKFYEVQKFCSLTNHAWDGFWLISSGKVWKTIPKDVQEVLQKHFNAAAKKQRDDIVQANADYQKTLESKGLTFNTTNAEVFQAALAKTSFYKDAKAKFGNEAWSLLQKYAGNIG